MPDIVRNFSAYVDSKKVATGSAHDYTITAGDELQIGDGQVVAASEGVTTTQLSIDAITTFGGIVELQALNNALLNKKWIQIALGLVNGQIHQVDMRVFDANYKTEMKTGTQHVSFKMQGKAPVIVG
jgi:hypothetical protein